MIRMVPLYGLCNRMRSMDAALYLGRVHKKQVKVYWNKNEQCGASFSDLFDPIDDCQISELDNNFPFPLRPGHKWNLYIPDILRSTGVVQVLDPHKVDYFPKQLEYYDQFINSSSRVYIKSYSEFLIPPDRYENFKPTAEIQAQIDREIQSFDEHTVSVHIRRTDHKQSTDQSPLSLFIDAMKTQIALNNATRFYVASDDLGVKEKLIKQFGSEKIMSKLAIAPRNEISGVQQALVELYALSKGKMILGSYYSSFSETAAAIGKIKLKTLRI